MHSFKICPVLMKVPFHLLSLPTHFSYPLKNMRHFWMLFHAPQNWRNLSGLTQVLSAQKQPATVSNAASDAVAHWCCHWLWWWHLCVTTKVCCTGWGPFVLGFSLNPPVLSIMLPFYLPSLACLTSLETSSWHYFLLSEGHPHLLIQIGFWFLHYLFSNLVLDI